METHGEIPMKDFTENKKTWRRGMPDRRNKDGRIEDRKLSADIIRINREHERKVRDIEKPYEHNAFVLAVCILLALAILMFWPKKVHAEDIDPDRLANAIFKAEHSTAHPYGILAHYKHTTPRQACLNTIKHQYKNWLKTNQTEPFLMYLSRHYAPLNASNDPTGLNYYWLYNVNYFLAKGN